MKGEFNHYDASVKGSRAMTDPALRVAKCGLISFNKLAVDKLKLHSGDGIKIHQSKARPKDWYIEKVKDGGIILRNYKDSLAFSCSAVAKAMVHALNLQKGFTVRIGSQPDEEGWWSLITSAISK